MIDDHQRVQGAVARGVENSPRARPEPMSVGCPPAAFSTTRERPPMGHAPGPKALFGRIRIGHAGRWIGMSSRPRK
jgi:hypothetical protein